MKRELILRFTVVMTALAIMSAAVSCKPSGDDPTPEDEKITLSGVLIPGSIEACEGDPITITGKGFAAGDVFRLSSVDQTPAVEFTAPLTNITAASAAFAIPEGISTGKYKITIVRNSLSLSLGTISFTLKVNVDVPELAGYNIRGLVFADGRGIEGAVVSDGVEVVKTNSKGIYYLKSDFKYGYVFISVPGGYQVETKDCIPQFFVRTNGGSQRIDFSLTKVDNDKHIVVTMADMHLANRNNDISQFTSGFMPDVRSLMGSYEARGIKAYGLTLGDMSWDQYWYNNSYALPDYLNDIKNLGYPIFNTTGNHDNDPYVADDWGAQQPFMKNVGPIYYSFNLGKIHYIVLDDIQYNNVGASYGVIGTRSYVNAVTADQMNWIAKDLAAIDDKTTPVMVAMHIQLHSNPSVSGMNGTSNISLTNGAALKNLFAQFKTVHVVTGHTHINYWVGDVDTEAQQFMEHNTAAVCATWWWTGKNGYAGNHICTDGSPGGYGVWAMDGKDMKWSYKGIGKAEDYQFRAYDLNNVHITADKYCPNTSDANKTAFNTTYATPYNTSNQGNQVLINVWGWDDKWSIEVTEAGKALNVTRVQTRDPLHIISYAAQRYRVANATPTFGTTNTGHMFRVTASSADSDLEIKVTDRFGNVYKQTMERPKAFSTSMN